MFESLSNWIFIALTVSIFLLAISGTLTRYKVNLKGECIWKDKGMTTKSFFNATYQVYGKPDLLFKTDKGIILVEYKSRIGKCYPNDIVQAKCAALAARGSGYPIYSIFIRTGSQYQFKKLPESDHELFLEIEEYIKAVRSAKMGHCLPAEKNRSKCRGCGYRDTCELKWA